MTEKLNAAVLHYKTIDQTIVCVDSLLRCDEVNIYIVDNHSADGSLERLKMNYGNHSNIKFIEMKTNAGFARANNYVMSELYNCGEKYVVLSNNDVVFTPDAVKNLIFQLKSNTSVLIAAPRVFTPEHKIQNSVQPSRDTSWQYMIHMIFPSRVRNFAETYENNTYVQMFSGCCFACNLELMDLIGYMDDYTFLYFEESILAAKAKERDLKIMYVPNAEVIHYHAVTTKSLNEAVYAYLLNSETYYLRRYLHVSKNVLLIYMRIKRLVHKIKYHSAYLYSLETEIICRMKRKSYEEP